MNEQTLIKDLTETEILAAVRERFVNQHVEGVDLDSLMDRTPTLGELFDAVQTAMKMRDEEKYVG